MSEANDPVDDKSEPMDSIDDQEYEDIRGEWQLDWDADLYIEGKARLQAREWFLRAIEEEAPEILVSLLKSLHLKDLDAGVVPHRRPPVETWAIAHQLLEPDQGGGSWIVAAAEATLRDWAHHPETAEPPRWSPDAASAELELPGFFKPPSERKIQFAPPELKGLPAWDPRVLSRDKYKEQTLRTAAERLDVYLEAIERRIMGDHMRRPDGAPKPEHLNWLVLYHVKRLSFNQIVELWHKRNEEIISRQGVTGAVDKAAKLLIGPAWPLWLRPRGKPGKPSTKPRQKKGQDWEDPE